MQSKKWTFRVLKAARWASEHEVPFENWILWVRAKDMPLDFPLDPNARYPDLKAKVARAIEKTLQTQPEEFIKRNNGLCMVAQKCVVRDNVATLYLDQVSEDEEDEGRRGDGILNGGHTYAVLRAVLNEQAKERRQGRWEPTDPDVEQAVIRIEVQTGLSEDQLADISRARNLSSPVKEFSLRNLGKSWEAIKNALPKDLRSRFAFMENDPEAQNAEYDVGDLVKLLVLFNSKLYPPGQKDPVAAFTSEKALISRWRPEDFEHLLKHLPTFIKLHDDLALMFPELMKSTGGKPGKLDGVQVAEKQRYHLMGGRESKYKIPAAFLFPVLAALRVFLAETGSKWLVAPEDLVMDGGVAEMLLLDAMRHYKNNGRSNASFFGRNRQVWELLCMRAQLLRQGFHNTETPRNKSGFDKKRLKVRRAE